MDHLNSAPLVAGDVITGRIVEVQQQTVFQTGAGRALGLLFENRPLQFAHQDQRTTLIVEPVAVYGNNADAPQRAISIFGDVSGLSKGHVIQAKVKERNGMLVATQLNNLTTNSTISPSPQVGAGAVKAFTLVAAVVLFVIAATIVCGIADGSLFKGVLNVLSGLIGGLAPFLVCAGVVYMLFASFRK